MIDTVTVEACQRGPDGPPGTLRQRTSRERRAQRRRIRDELCNEIAPVGHAGAPVESSDGLGNPQTSLHKVVEQSPLGEGAHPILAQPPVSILEQSRDETSPAVVTQHQRL